MGTLIHLLYFVLFSNIFVAIRLVIYEQKCSNQESPEQHSVVVGDPSCFSLEDEAYPLSSY